MSGSLLYQTQAPGLWFRPPRRNMFSYLILNYVRLVRGGGGQAVAGEQVPEQGP